MLIVNFAANPYDAEAGDPSTQVLEVDFGREIRTSEENPFVLTLKMAEKGRRLAGAEPGRLGCGWWDTNHQVWNGDGCKLAGITDEGVVCHCTHLTAFAAVMRGLRIWHLRTHWRSHFGLSHN